MRLMLLATTIVLGLCLAYTHHLDASAPGGTASYDGPAVFDSIACDRRDDGSPRWYVICHVAGDRIALLADREPLLATARDLSPDQPVHVRYDLPCDVTENGATYSPPTLRGISRAASPQPALAFAMNTSGQ